MVWTFAILSEALMAASSLPNLSSPSTRAAMRVLGVVPKDIEPLNPTHPSFSSAVRLEKYERKRCDIIRKVAALAETTPKRKHSLGEGGDGEDDGSEGGDAFLEAVVAREQANVAKMQKRAEQDIKQIILDEMTIKEAKENADKKMREAREKMLAFKKERAAQLAELKKLAEKRAERTAAVREKADEALKTKSIDLFKELTETMKRKEGKMAQLAEEWRLSRSEGATKNGLLQQRHAKYESDLFQKRQDMWEDYQKRHEAHDDLLKALANSRVSKSEELNAKLRRSIEASKAYQEAQQQHRDEEYKKISEKFQAAQECRTKTADEKLTAFKKRNEKDRASFAKNYDAMKVEAETMAKEMTRRSLEHPGRSASDPRMESMKAFWHNNEVHAEIVEKSKAMLLRARRYATVQALELVKRKRDKVTALQESRRKVENRRAEARIHCAHMKEELSRKVDRVRNAPAADLHDMLVELGLQAPKKGDGEDEGEK